MAWLVFKFKLLLQFRVTRFIYLYDSGRKLRKNSFCSTSNHRNGRNRVSGYTSYHISPCPIIMILSLPESVWRSQTGPNASTLSRITFHTLSKYSMTSSILAGQWERAEEVKVRLKNDLIFLLINKIWIEEIVSKMNQHLLVNWFNVNFYTFSVVFTFEAFAAFFCIFIWPFARQFSLATTIEWTLCKDTVE